MNALSLVLISLSCVLYIARDPSNISPCVVFFLTHKSQLIIRRIVGNTLAAAKEHGKFCPLEKEGDIGFLGQCLHSCTSYKTARNVSNWQYMSSYWVLATAD